MKRSLFRLLAAGLLTACGSATPTPTLSAELFSDDFSRDLSLWEVFTESGATAQINDGHLALALTQPSSVAFSMAAINITDFDLTVRASFGGGLMNSYGVIFRYLDPQNFYRFDVTGDGLWGLSRRQNDQWISIVELQPSPAIHSGPDASNQLRLVARADNFVFYANGAELGHTVDNNLSRGRVGLFVSTFDEPDARVNFDDLNIVRP